MSKKSRFRFSNSQRASLRGQRALNLGFESLENRSLFTIDLPPLVDINPALSAVGSNPEAITQVGTAFYFTATTNSNGRELWKSDGTFTGTVLVKDIRVGANGSAPENLTNINGTLYFSANDGVNGIELWKSDGTEAGTVMVRNIRSGADGSEPKSFANVNGTLFFSASDGETDRELWKSDGTSVGTVLVKDIRAGVNSSNLAAFSNVNGTLLFQANDGTHGLELWKSDGTSDGTSLVEDLFAGTNGSSILSQTVFNGKLYFTADDGIHGRELWKSDGTEAGTELVNDTRPGNAGSFPRNLIELNGSLYFSASNETIAEGLWKTDGTAAGTELVTNLRVGTSAFNFVNFTNVSGTLYFTGNYGPFSYGSFSYGYRGTELWKSDGTTNGTLLVKDFHVDTFYYNLGNLTNLNGSLFFSANDGTNGYELWKSDGTATGTSLLSDINIGDRDSNPSSLTNIDGTLYFKAESVSDGFELWRSDGTNGGTNLFKNIASGSGDSNIGRLTDLDSILYFNANRGVWKSDGTLAGTNSVTNNRILLPYLASSPQTVNLNGILYFSANNTLTGYELWKSDGTFAGTTLVKDIGPSMSNGSPSELTILNGMLYFIANDGVHGAELWKSDGTEAGTQLVQDIFPGAGSSNIGHLTTLNQTLFFTAENAVSGNELWKSDGTAAGTVVVKDITPGFRYGRPRDSNPTYLTNVNGTLYFTADTPNKGLELWKSDGTGAGTLLVKDIFVGADSSRPRYLTNVNGTLYFSATDSNGTELWKSNGTAAGTSLVSNIRAGTASSFPRFLTNVNGTLYFQADDGIHGNELWKSNGSAASTVLVKDILNGVGSSAPRGLTNVNGILYFNGNDGILGEELWMSDGTAGGTSMVIDISSAGSNPADFFPIDNKLFFTASTDSYGRELYVVSIQTAPQDIVLSNASIEENLPANTTVGTFSTVDPDTNDAFVYSLVSGLGDQDNAQFAIVGNQLQTLRSLDFETQSSYSIRVRSTDKFGLYIEETHLISVTNTSTLSAFVSLSGILSVMDEDPVGKNNRLSISVTGGTLVIADVNEEFGSAPDGWVLSTDSKSLSRPLASFSGPLYFLAGRGADQLTIDFSGAVLTSPIRFDGGADDAQDSFTVTGLTAVSTFADFQSNIEGNFQSPGFSPIFYSNVDSVDLDVRSVNMYLRAPSSVVPTAVTLGDDGIVGNGLLKLSGGPVTTTFRRPTGTLSLLGGNSPVTVTALPDLRSNLVLGSTTLPLVSVDFAGPVPVALTSNRYLSAYATNSIILSTSDSDLSTSGLGRIHLQSETSIQLLAGSSITTERGEITLMANDQATSTVNAVGIDVENATIQSFLGSIMLRGRGGANEGVANIGVIVAGSLVRSSSNSVSIKGFGGGTGSSTLNHGVRLNAGGVISGGNAVTVVGNAGTAVTSSNNFGVTIFDAGSQITSSGGVVTVTGVGGGNASSTGGTNHGVRVSGGGVITSTGTSSFVSVTGIGGPASGANNTGVLVINAGSQITSASGALSVNGTGGGNSSSKQNYGVAVNSGGVISTTGTQSLRVAGTGGNTSGIDTENYGVAVSGTGSKVAATGGTLSVEGTGTSNSEALRLTNGASISNTNSNIVLSADSIAIAGTPLGSIAAGTGEVSIVPRTWGTQIVLGGPDLLSSIPQTLGIAGTELNQISGASLKIGSSNSGKLTTIANLTRSRPINLALASASEIEIAAPINLAGGTLLLGGDPLATTRPTAVGTDVTASTITLGASLTLEINNGNVDIGYNQLRAVGAVNLNRSRLLIAGNAPTITGKETLTIVSASSITGTFLGMADGSLVNVHGYLYRIKYNPTTVQLLSQARLFDFDHAGVVSTASGYQSVLPTDLYTPAKGYGWNAAVTSLARTSAAASPIDLYRDKHVSSVERSFFVSAVVGQTYDVQVVLGDQSSRSVAISVDGGLTFRTVTTAANQYRAERFSGIVATSARIEIRFKSGNTAAWAVDGIEVMRVASATANMRAEGEAVAGKYAVPHDVFFAEASAWDFSITKRKRV